MAGGNPDSGCGVAVTRVVDPDGYVLVDGQEWWGPFPSQATATEFR